MADTIQLYGDSINITVSFLDFTRENYNKRDYHSTKQEVSHLLDGNVWELARGSVYAYPCNLEDEVFHVYTTSPDDTVYSVGLAAFRDKSVSVFTVYVNDEPFELVKDNTITIGGIVYTTKDVLRVASKQNTGIYMLTGNTYYVVYGDLTAQSFRKQPHNVQRIVIEEE